MSASSKPASNSAIPPPIGPTGMSVPVAASAPLDGGLEPAGAGAAALGESEGLGVALGGVVGVSDGSGVGLGLTGGCGLGQASLVKTCFQTAVPLISS